MKNNFLKAMFFIVFFLIFGLNAKASTAKCTYGDDRFGIEINIDSEFNITYKKVGTNINYVNISSFVLDLGDFRKSSNELFCPSQIKYKITSHSRSADYDMIVNTNDASYNFSIKLDDNKSVVNNNSNNNSGNNNVNLVRSCSYSNYIVNVYSDGSIKASRANYTVTVEDPDNKFLNGCLDQVYVSDSNGRGGNYASIYTYSTPSGTVTKLTGNNGNNNNNSGSNNNNNTNNNGSNGNENCHSIVSKNFHDFLQKMLDFIKYLGPTLVAIFTIIDLIKAALSGDAGEMKKMSQKLIKRLIAALLLFFIPLIVNLIFDLVGITGPYVCSDFK